MTPITAAGSHFAHPLSRRMALAGLIAGPVMVGARGVATGQEALGATPVSNDDVTSYLFVQSGFTSGSLVANADGTYSLTLLNAPAQTVYFSDRPDRIVGAIDTARLLEALGFGEGDPPNAALVIGVDADNTDVIVLSLAEPLYDAGVASLTYRATLLEGLDQFVETGVGFVEEPLTADTLPQEFGASSLFIDDIHWNPGGF